LRYDGKPFHDLCLDWHRSIRHPYRNVALMRKVLVGFLLVLVISGVAYLRFHHRKPPLAVAYAGSRQLVLWSTTAQIREPVGKANFGDRLDVLNRFDDQVQVHIRGGLGVQLPEELQELLMAMAGGHRPITWPSRYSAP